MKREIVAAFALDPAKFGRFCQLLLEGEPYYWKGKELTNKETREIYAIMRELFPYRKEG